MLEHPLVVEELREVRAARVGEHREHLRVGAEARRDLERGPDRRPGRAAGEQALLAREPPRGQERVAVGDAHPLVDDVGSHRLGPGVLADPLDEVGMQVASSVAV